jgi:energy-coupling factor transport system substrate-specific component
MTVPPAPDVPHPPAERPPAATSTAIRLRARSTLALILVSLAGVIAFGWPLIVDPGSGLAHGNDAPFVFALLLPLLLAVVLAEIANGGLDVKAVAMLGVLSAVGAVLRPLGAGSAGVELVFFLLVLAGRVFGPGFGFVLGATTLFASALITGGVGPWLPYQMLGAAWVGLGAGLLPRARGGGAVRCSRHTAASVVCSMGGCSTFRSGRSQLGTGTGLSFEPGANPIDNLHRFALFSLATSFGWDLGPRPDQCRPHRGDRPAVLGALRRAARKAAFGAADHLRTDRAARPVDR